MTIDVTVMRRVGCHLCDAVEAEIRSIRPVSVSLSEIDIDGDPALQARYGLRIPVVLVSGRELFEAKMMDLQGRWKPQLAALLGAQAEA